MKRFISGIIVLIMLFLLFGCSGVQKDLTTKDGSLGDKPSEQEPVKGEEKNDHAPSETAYFFSEGLLLGSFDKNGWHSLCDTSGNYEIGAGNAAAFYAQDLLAVPEYHVCKDQTLLGDAKHIIWQTEEDFGLGSFESEGIKEKFSQYGKLYHFEGNSHTSHRIFSLPTTLGPEFNGLKIPEYSFWTYFPIGEDWSYEQNTGTLVTNSGSASFPADLEKNIAATSEAEKTLRKLFADAGMGNTISHFIQGFKADFNGDGRDEYIFAANHPTPEENGYWPIIEGEGTKDDVGTFSVLLYQDGDGAIQILHSDLHRFTAGPVTFSGGQYNIMDIEHCHTLKLTDIADLNGDGRYEFIIEIGLWEGGFKAVFAPNPKGTYETVLRTNFGM